ncbi:MAG: hypothetical protein M3Y58_12955 [Chloroflexota bacterium]|nr:hypothetical protein [Chloroflexota bacterium]
MSDQRTDRAASTTSTGHVLAAGTYLDAHFAMCRCYWCEGHVLAVGRVANRPV